MFTPCEQSIRKNPNPGNRQACGGGRDLIDQPDAQRPVDAIRLDASGWLDPVRRLQSPHCDARPPDTPPELLVIHNISLPPGEFGGPWIDHLFLGRLDPHAHAYFKGIAQLRVSAHLLVRRDGAVTQYAPLTARAWHAGASCFGGRPACNDYSIGIELEGTDQTPYADAQYGSLQTLGRCIMAAYPAITPGRIVGHADIAPGRKTDPGPAFDWARFRHELRAAPSTPDGNRSHASNP